MSWVWPIELGLYLLKQKISYNTYNSCHLNNWRYLLRINCPKKNDILNILMIVDEAVYKPLQQIDDVQEVVHQKNHRHCDIYIYIYIHPGVYRLWNFPRIMATMGISLKIPYSIILSTISRFYSCWITFLVHTTATMLAPRFGPVGWPFAPLPWTE